MYLSEEQQYFINQYIHRYDKLNQMTKDYAAFPREARVESLLGKSEISTIENNLIAYVHNQPEINMTELASRLFMKKPNLTKLVDKMEQKGFILRIPNPSDRRSYHLQITEHTEEIFNHSHLLAAKIFYDNLMLLTTEEERKKMLDSYKYILDIFERFERHDRIKLAEEAAATDTAKKS